MYQFFVEPNQICGNQATILGGDVNHIRNVLRMKAGDEILIKSDVLRECGNEMGHRGQDHVPNADPGSAYLCRLASLEEDRILCEVISEVEDFGELPARIHLFQGLPKADKMEWIIQKAVELGVYEIVPVATHRCVVKLDEKKASGKVARWQAIAEAAAKQSKRGIVPRIGGVLPLEQALKSASAMDLRWIPYEQAQGMEHTRECLSKLRPGQDVAVFIGPEGGFEEAEIRQALEHGVEPITLGRRILRTETAGLTVLAWILYQLEH